MPEISIIVPVYKVEKYLDRCVKSILVQTFTDFELILVDDGSPDNCPQMCDEWAKKDERIRVIHKENGGLSSARNAGMKVAIGNYIGFVDSDDWISKDMYELLYNGLISAKADYAVCEMTIAKNENPLYEQLEYKEMIMNKDSLFKMFFRVTDADIHYCACDKLIKSDILKNIRFWEGMRFEDIYFNYEVIQHCKRGIYINQKKYFWFYNEQSITRNKLIPVDMQLFEIWEEILKQCQKNYPEYVYYAKMNYERAFMGILGKAVKYGVSPNYKNWDADKKYLLNNLRKYFKDLIKWNMPLSRKVLLCLLCISPEMTRVPFLIREKIKR